MDKMTYAVIIERAADGGWGGYAPDVSGVAVGGYATSQEARDSVRVAIEMQIEARRELGQTVPMPTSQVATVEVAP